MKQIILTDEGLKKLEEELNYLKTEGRKDVSEKIKQAKSFGDLSENSEYDEAKNEQAIIEARIAQIESMLKNAKVLDEDEIDTNTISLGSKVVIKDIELDEEFEYYIVGSTEADPSQMKISDESPLGKALLGHKVGDEVQVEAPAGTILYRVLNISK